MSHHAPHPGVADRSRCGARALAARLADGPTNAFGAAKNLLLSSATESLETQMELEGREIAAAACGHEGQEGIEAFVSKRAPTFRFAAGPSAR